ncbi:MAG: hypothetical protein Q8S33_20025 [Myxococcales bacterium]|nr:hypothetical protein [Myxococcales bacterium]
MTPATLRVPLSAVEVKCTPSGVRARGRGEPMTPATVRVLLSAVEVKCARVPAFERAAEEGR